MKKRSVKKISVPLDAARKWAMACHLSSLAGLIVPFGNVIVPLILWLMKRHQYPFVDDQGKESINFQLSMIIYYLIAALLIVIVIGFLFLAMLVIFNIASVVIASSESYQGKRFRYWGSIRLIK